MNLSLKYLNPEKPKKRGGQLLQYAAIDVEAAI
jgi:hypothetical protein